MRLVLQQLVAMQRFIQQPLMPVLGMLAAAAAAKIGHGEWAAGTLLLVLVLIARKPKAIGVYLGKKQ